MDLWLQAVADVVIGRLLDHTAAVGVPVRGRPLDEVLRERGLLVLVLHLGRIVVRYFDWFVLGRVQRVSACVGPDARRLMELNACPRGVVHAVGSTLIL